VKKIIRCHHRGEIHVLPLLREFAMEFCSILKTSHLGGLGEDSTAEPLVPGEGITPLRPLANWIFLL